MRIAKTIFIKYLFLKEQIFVFFKYYKNIKFAFADSFLLIFSFFYNPYRTSRKFLKKKEKKDLHMYGETPVSTFEKIIRRSKIKSEDFILDLGSGRGKLCFFLACHIGCRTCGIEQIPVFVTLAKFITKFFKIKNLEFFCDNILNANIKKANTAYLYGSNLEENEIIAIINQYKYIDKFITISYPLSRYVKGMYKTVDKFQVTFPWGTGDCYINKKI